MTIQPETELEKLDAGYASLTARARWQPFSSRAEEFRGVYLSAELIGRKRLWGDDRLPRSTSQVDLSLGYNFNQSNDSDRNLASIALAYSKGRDPLNGFVEDETISLTLEFLLNQ